MKSRVVFAERNSNSVGGLEHQNPGSETVGNAKDGPCAQSGPSIDKVPFHSHSSSIKSLDHRGRRRSL